MERKTFLKLIGLSTIGMSMTSLADLNRMSHGFTNTPKMPVLFVGHGSPMNAIEENQFVQGFRNAAKSIPKPNAILCVSAHWLTNGTKVTAMGMPPTIHDFGGFPQALFDVQYPAPGSPELAKEAQALLAPTHVDLDDAWGLDHGTWSVLKHFYPDADIPVIEISLPTKMNAEEVGHFKEREYEKIMHKMKPIHFTGGSRGNGGFESTLCSLCFLR